MLARSWVDNGQRHMRERGNEVQRLDVLLYVFSFMLSEGRYVVLSLSLVINLLDIVTD